MLKVSLKEIKEIERFILINIIGLLESLKKNAITIDDTEIYLFSPYSVDILSEKGINKEIIELVELGCELEDIESLLPDKLYKNIESLLDKALNLLEGAPKSDNPYEIEKWLDNE